MTLLGHRIPPWLLGLGIAAIPAGTYAWMLYTRPDIYSQIAEEIKRQEEQESLRTGAAGAMRQRTG
jgi:hypothetical protein